MSPELHAMLTTWLDAGTEAQRAHARHRLSLPSSTVEKPRPAAAPTIPVAESLALIRRMEACPDREKRTNCGCAGLATCHRGKGDARGLVSPQRCFECLREGN